MFKISLILWPLRRAAGVVDRGRLEICCTSMRYRGFESLALRLIMSVKSNYWPEGAKLQSAIQSVNEIIDAFRTGFRYAIASSISGI